MDKPYHPTCLTCRQCNCSLPAAFSPVNGAPHCAHCARTLLSRKNTSSAPPPPSSHLSPSSAGNSAPSNQKRQSKRQSTRVTQPPCAKCAKPLRSADLPYLFSFHFVPAYLRMQRCGDRSARQEFPRKLLWLCTVRRCCDGHLCTDRRAAVLRPVRQGALLEGAASPLVAARHVALCATGTPCAHQLQLANGHVAHSDAH